MNNTNDVVYYAYGDNIRFEGLDLTETQIEFIKVYENATGEIFNVTKENMEYLNKGVKWYNKYSNVTDVIAVYNTTNEVVRSFKEGNHYEVLETISKFSYKIMFSEIFVSNLAWAMTITAVNPFIAFVALIVVGVFVDQWGDLYGEMTADVAKDILGLFDDAGAFTYPVDPLIFDLDGDGIETTSVKNGVNFDFDQNGFAEKIGWVGADDGLLVRDLNGNGNIDNGGELFGDLTQIADGVTAVNGFEALAAFDLNGDGIIDALDAIYKELKIWQDKNQNGVVDAGELFTLDELGIAGIGLGYENIDEVDEQGNAHSQRGYYVKKDGSTGTVEDVWFDKEASDTVVVGDQVDDPLLEETEDIQRLPDIEGKGNQYSLHQAMLRDETGALQSLVEQYIAEKDFKVRKEMLTQIIYVWTGVEDLDPAGRGSNISDARKLAALEVITGRGFDSAYGTNPVYQAGKYLEQAFDQLVDLYYTQLEMQTTYAEEYAQMYLNMDVNDDGELTVDFTSIAQQYLNEYENDFQNGKLLISRLVENLMKTGFDSYVGKDVMTSLFSSVAADIYHAAEHYGDDTIIGTKYDDIITGESGNDILNGGFGDDTYIFYLGDGQDTINEASGTDRILFGEGIMEEDILVSRDAADLYLTNRKTGDRITVREFFHNMACIVEEVEFADGTKWDLDMLLEKARCYYGTDGDDVINAFDSYYGLPIVEDDTIYAGAGDDVVYGNNGNDELYGEAGNDTLNGGIGNDVLVGGIGNDILNGGAGNDTYIFNIGDGEDIINEASGTDRILFGEGIMEEDILVSRDAADLYLTNRKTGDRITVREFFHNMACIVEEVEFADGTKWDLDMLLEKARCYYGTDGDDVINAFDSYYGLPIVEDDTIYAGAGDDVVNGKNGNDILYGEAGNDTLNGGIGNDVLVGGIGNDILNGGAGNDTYIFNIGDGEDIINEGNGTDCIVFGEGIMEEDILVSRDAADLYLTNRKTGDRITVREFFHNMACIVEEVEFADGTKWDLDMLLEKARCYYGTDGDDVINAFDSYYGLPIVEDDTIYAGAGDDVVNGKNGNDILYGEAGNDTLNGGVGNDVLVGGTGNDILNGGVGDDTYIFNLGDGQDTINETNGNDQIVFGTDISSRDLTFARVGNNLKISVIGQQDSITINNYYINDAYKVESFHTSDGRVLDYTKLELMIQAMASFEDTTGMMWQDAIESNNEQANDIINQWWTKEAV